MFKINRTTEYGLIALQHMSRKRTTSLSPAEPAEVTSAREVADTYGLPFEITAKTLQRLKDTGLIQSAQGARGGYTILRALNEISLAEFLRLMEGPQSVVVCTSSGHKSPSAAGTADKPVAPAPQQCQCEYERACEIKLLMGKLNGRVYDFLASIRLSELINSSAPVAKILNRTSVAETTPLQVGNEN